MRPALAGGRPTKVLENQHFLMKLYARSVNSKRTRGAASRIAEKRGDTLQMSFLREVEPCQLQGNQLHVTEALNRSPALQLNGLVWAALGLGSKETIS